MQQKVMDHRLISIEGRMTAVEGKVENLLATCMATHSNLSHLMYHFNLNEEEDEQADAEMDESNKDGNK